MARKPREQVQPVARDLPFDKYEMRTISRSQLKGAPYNPRVMGDDERAKLKAGLQKHGMVQPLVWNERSGNVVGGHQRMKSMDDLAGGTDYTLQVAVINVDDAAEKELNVLLNNPQAQGDWDLEKLEAILRDPSVDIVGAGFDMADVYRLFGDAPGGSASAEEMTAAAEQLRKVKEEYREITAKAEAKRSLDYYIVVVFRDAEGRRSFLDTLGLDDNRYQDGRKLEQLLAPPSRDQATQGEPSREGQ